jgi:DNA-binding NarL/FixJ family response regulator
MGADAPTRRETRSRVLVVDDHAPMLAHVAGIVEKEFTVVGVVQDVDALMTGWRAARPDVVVLDVSLLRGSGFEAAIRLRTCGCDAAIVFLSVHEEAEVVRASWVAGGLGYVAKRDLAAELLPAIRSALRGQRYTSAAVAAC